MKHTIPAITATLLCATSPALAQVTPTPADTNAQRVATANGEVAARAHSEASMNAEQRDQYTKDMEAYSAALQAQHRAERADARQFERQQRAYANAMFDWRIQVDACHRGNNRACNAPTPNPADYL